MNWAILWFTISVILFLVLVFQHVDNNRIFKALVRSNEERFKLEREVMTGKAKWAIGLFALRDIRDQNKGQATFEIWAKQRAKDAIERMGKYDKK